MTTDRVIDDSVIDNVRARADIVAVVADVVSTLRWNGAAWSGLCPFHKEKTPSFHVNPHNRFFHCFGCGVGGDVIRFVELYRNVSCIEAVRILAGRVGLTIPEIDRRHNVGRRARDRRVM